MPLTKPAATASPDAPAGEFTHYVHLADGRVIKLDMDGAPSASGRVEGNYYVEGEYADDGTDNRVQTQVIGVYPR